MAEHSGAPEAGRDIPGKDSNGLPILPDECMPAPCPVGSRHSRMRDVHFWLGSGGVPTLSILKPGRPIRGWDPQIGSGFFYFFYSRSTRGCPRRRRGARALPPRSTPLAGCGVWT
ncbi:MULTISPECIES: hypothetical protein [unclassified Streptomyces]|uniref:hypothetical protein n=1 Tax=unclassified Streptomyces TaxID=2593676 RepID=UPI002365BA58|nr:MULTISPECIES: hypothetical protein [unclassified Streptomyces]MDF3146532.1 hypothetical protein [Streptomyces sp. T21Q-yed]WDF38919.1 hypothetical protein PBV52_19995 [Streptomyces sp. T12]